MRMFIFFWMMIATLCASAQAQVSSYKFIAELELDFNQELELDFYSEADSSFSIGNLWVTQQGNEDLEPSFVFKNNSWILLGEKDLQFFTNNTPVLENVSINKKKYTIYWQKANMYADQDSTWYCTVIADNEKNSLQFQQFFFHARLGFVGIKDWASNYWREDVQAYYKKYTSIQL
jgi:hypothetical protein